MSGAVVRARLSVMQPSVAFRSASAATLRPCTAGDSDHDCEECGKKRTLRRKAADGGAVKTVPPIVHQVMDSPGEPLDRTTRTFMESRFGHDFSQVRVHTDARAAASAQAVNAVAYTAGEHIVLGGGYSSLASSAGRQLLAHELTHVVQHGPGPVSRGELRLGDAEDPAEVEAERAAATSHPPGKAGLRPQSDPRFLRRVLDPNAGSRPSSDPYPEIETGVLGAFDMEVGEGKRPWNLDRLMQVIREALLRYPDGQVEVLGLYDPGVGEQASSARDRAKKNADLVRERLIQRVPMPTRTINANSFDRGLFSEPQASGMDREIAVMLFRGTQAAVRAPALIVPGLPLVTPQPALAPVPQTPPGTPSVALQPGAAAPYPAKGLDAWRVFLSSPPGQEFKEKVKAIGLREWKRFSREPDWVKILILAMPLLPVEIALYARSQFAGMSEKGKKEIIQLITGDVDTSLLRPLQEKTQLYLGLDVDPGLRPRQVRTPGLDWALPAHGEPRAGGSALGADLRVDKPALKTFFKPDEPITVTYTTPDGGWWIDIVSSEDESIVVQKQRIPDPMRNATMGLIAPAKPGIYMVRLVDRDGKVKRSIRFQVLQ